MTLYDIVIINGIRDVESFSTVTYSIVVCDHLISVTNNAIKNEQQLKIFNNSFKLICNDNSLLDNPIETNLNDFIKEVIKC